MVSGRYNAKEVWLTSMLLKGGAVSLLSSGKDLGIVEVFDGCVTPLRDMPRGYGADSKEFRHWSKGWAINTMAGVDANGRFTSFTSGYAGSAGDEAMLRNLHLFKANQGDPNGDRDAAYPSGCIALGDGGFGLKTWMMLPFSNALVMRQVGDMRNALKLYNFKLSQLRVVVEQTF